MSEIKGLAPVIDNNSRVLILGTMPGEESLRKQEYYGNPRNQFWPIIYSIFDTNFGSSYEARIAFIKEKGIALWDVIKCCKREGSADSRIFDMSLNDINHLLAEYPGIKGIFFGGNEAYRIFHKHVGLELQRSLTLKVLPSTSPANARMSMEAKIKEWVKLKDFL